MVGSSSLQLTVPYVMLFFLAINVTYILKAGNDTEKMILFLRKKNRNKFFTYNLHDSN